MNDLTNDENPSLNEIIKRLEQGKLSPQLHARLTQNLKNIGLLFEQTVKKINFSMLEILKPLVESTLRAKYLLAIMDEKELSISDIHEKIQNNLDDKGHLTAHQIMFLMLEAGGVDTSKMAKNLAAKGGRAKAGNKCDLYKGLVEVTNKIEDCSYIKVKNFLNKSSNWENIDAINIFQSSLPAKSDGEGQLKYKNSKERDKTVGYSGVNKHLTKIRNEKTIPK